MPGDEILMNFSGTKWLKIHTLQSLYDSMQKLSGTKYRMVAGNTGIGKRLLGMITMNNCCFKLLSNYRDI